MMSEMNKQKFEKAWALPQLNVLCEAAKDIKPAANPIGFLKAIFADNIKAILWRTKMDVTADQLDNETLIKLNTRKALYVIYNLDKRFSEIRSRCRPDDRLFVKKIRERETLKNDKRFNQYRAGGSEPYLIPITEADNGWFKKTSMGQIAVSEKKELIRLQAEVSNRVRIIDEVKEF
jgi:hypothetical protein